MKFIWLILALAVYGAYSLVGSFTSAAGDSAKEVAAQADSTAKDVLSHIGLSSAADVVGSAATALSGIDLQPLPESGCSESALSPSQVLELINQLPDAQRIAVAKVLDVSSSVWSVQLYSGDGGLGLCLPAKGKLIRLSNASANGWSFSPDDVTDVVRSAADAVTNSINK